MVGRNLRTRGLLRLDFHLLEFCNMLFENEKNFAHGAHSCLESGFSGNRASCN
jgi:hypothetical protein